MVSKLLIFNEKAKTFRLFENDSFDQLKLEIIQFNLNLNKKERHLEFFNRTRKVCKN